MTAYERYCQLRDGKGIKDAAVATQTNIPKSTFTEWRRGNYEPKREKMQKIADFFGVSVEWLMFGVTPGGEDWYQDPETASLAKEIHDNPDLQAIIHAARDTSPEDMKKIIQMIYVMKGEHKE